MSKFVVKLSDGVKHEYDEKDTIDLIVDRQYITPKTRNRTVKCKDRSYESIVVQNFDVVNLKFVCVAFILNDYPDANEAEKAAKVYFDKLEKYEPLNIQKYVVILPIKKVFQRKEFFQRVFRYYVKPIEYEEVDVPIDPYIYGIWIGDGNSHNCGITNIDEEIIKAYTNYCETLDLEVFEFSKYGYIGRTKKLNNLPYSGKLTPKETVMDILTDKMNGMLMKDISEKHAISKVTINKYYKIYLENGFIAIDEIYDRNNQNMFNAKLKELNVINNKHIHEIYKKNSREVRLQVLAGFIDTDGYLSNGSVYEITQGIKNEKIFDDIKEIAESLGFRVSKTNCIKTCTYLGEKKECPAVRGFITGDVHLIPVKVKYKKVVNIKTQRYDLLKFKIKQVKEI